MSHGVEVVQEFLVGGEVWLQPTWNLEVQLTLFQLGGGADYANHITACPLGFENLTASLLYVLPVLKY